jgi:hypothetical protein
MMAKYLGIPLTVSNGNKTPLTAQSELVDNGNFEDGTTDWLTTDATIAVVDGQLEVTSTASFGKSEQSVTTVPGKAYVVSAKVTAGTVPGRLELFSTPNILSSGSVGETVDSGYKIVSRSFVATSTTTTIQLKCQSATLGTALFDNVTLKEIAATETPTYGSPQLIPNSDFTSGSGWDFSAGSGASISNDELTFASSPNLAFASTDTTVLEKFKRYVVKIDITSLTGDNPRIRVVAGGDSATYSPYYSVTGVYTHTFTASDSNTNGKIQVYFYSDTTGDATVNSVTLYEVPFVIGTRELVKNGDFRNGTTGWSPYVNASLSVENNKLRIVPTVASTSRATQGFKTEIGKTYSITASFENPNSSTVLIGLSPNADGGSATFDQSTASSGTINVFYTATSSTTYASLSRNNNDTNPIYYSDVSVVEIGYNYLQVADGGFTKSVKEGDVVFNTSTGTEGVVKEVIDNNVLLMSNNNFSTADEFFNVFAANGDTRGNQIVRIDNYIMSEYDEDPSNPQESSFWYAGGVDADKVTLTHLVPATNTFFVADLIESYTERLNNQSATASRLDIPLDAFRDHKHNEVLTTTFITLS